jgi:hypothetical protein
MTISYLGAGILSGLSTDVKPVTYPVNYTFFEEDTQQIYFWDGTAWNLHMMMGGGGGGGDVATTTANTYLDFDQIFRSGRLKLTNPSNTFNYSITASAIAANRSISFPLLTADDMVACVGFNNAWTAVQNFLAGTQVNSDVITTNTASQTLTNKTLTAPVISTISNTGTVTLPTSTDTLVGRATTDTLTNKTLTTPTVNTPVYGSYTDYTRTTLPSNPAANFGRMYVKQIDSSNDGLFILLKKAGSYVEVQIA